MQELSTEELKMNWYKKAYENESSTFTCPDCGAKQRFLADEWPDKCSCGYDPNKPDVCEKCKTETDDLEKYIIKDFPYATSLGYLCPNCREEADIEQATNPWKSPR